MNLSHFLKELDGGETFVGSKKQSLAVDGR
jgi:hypothetical protein